MKKKESKNYLERCPEHSSGIEWTMDENSIVTLSIYNKGVFNKIAQKLFKKPKISYIHLDEMGSFVWSVTDGKKDLIEIGKLLEEKFSDKAKPIYERVAKYFQILDSYGFVKWVGEDE